MAADDPAASAVVLDTLRTDGVDVRLNTRVEAVRSTEIAAHRSRRR